MVGKMDLSLVVPVYKEEATIRAFLARSECVLDAMQLRYEIIFCLDPSPDHSEQIILEEIQRNPNIKLLVFSRRFGQPAATMAGILTCQGKACVVIDIDLQDPPEVIPTLYAKLQEGYEVVYAKRRSRDGETRIRLMLTHIGYWIMNKCSGVSIPRNVGDFRMMSRRVIEEMRRLNESHGFLKGLVAFVGFKQAQVEYDREKRCAGCGNYNRFTGSIPIALNGIISFSSRPLFLISGAGLLLVIMSMMQGICCLMIGKTVLPPMVGVIGFFTGLQLLGLGLIGEYVGRIYDEVKQRPMYIVDRKVNFEKNKS